MSLKPAIVLVHGAWHRPECFSVVAEHLEAAGYEVHCPRLASVNTHPPIETHIVDSEIVRQTIVPLVDQDRDVILFGHSYGGIVINDAAKGLGKNSNPRTKGGITHLIYCCAVVLKEGESLLSFASSGFESSGFESGDMPWNTANLDEGTIVVNEGVSRSIFYNDVEPGLAEECEKMIGVHSLKTFLSPVEYCGWKEIPSTYIYCEDDATIPAIAQDRMIQRAGVFDVKTLKAGHSPFISQPDNVVEIIKAVAGGEDNR